MTLKSCTSLSRDGQQTLLLNGRRLDHVQLILLAIEDITERKQAEDALQQLNATLERRVEERTLDLQRSNQELNEFAYVASHDLRLAFAGHRQSGGIG